MPQKSHKPEPRASLTSDIQAFVRRRAGTKADGRTALKRNHLEIQLLINELDNILLRMNAADTSVLLAREKLADLKKQIGKTLDLK